jgi:hypothetical protein
MIIEIVVTILRLSVMQINYIRSWQESDRMAVQEVSCEAERARKIEGGIAFATVGTK